MPNTGDILRDSLIELIKSWGINGLEVYKEPYVGQRFLESKRNLDIVLRYKEKSLGIEAKYQESQGTTYQKLVYSLEDCKTSPILTIIVFAGEGIKIDVKTFLINSGLGYEVKFNEQQARIIEGQDILKQRILMELGLNWLEDQKEKIQ